MRKLSVLLVEGDPAIRQAMANVLEAKFGIGSVTCVDTLAAAVALRLADFDLVLTEWRLADASGPAVIEALRGNGAAGVVVVTESNVGAAAVEAILCGASDYIVRHCDYLVTLPLVVEKNLAFERLRRERDTLHRQLREQNETLEHLLHSLEEAAATDPLTGLYNRRHFAVELERMYDNARRAGEDLSCVMIDMDGFKLLNDTYGHQAGDAALVTTAQTVRDNLRKMDAAARYGGDEFVLLLPRTDVLVATAVARRIRDAYQAEMRSRGFTTSPLGMSFGVASVTADGPGTADELVASADAALYRAKRAGRERVYAAPGPGNVPTRAAS